MATGTSIPYLVILLTLCLFSGVSCASEDRKHQVPSAMVVGAVYCDTCFNQQPSKTSHLISGAGVAVECGGDAAAARPSFRKEARTDKHGVFRVRLPPSIGKHLKSIQACSVKLVSSSEPLCAVAASATSSFLRLRSTQQGLYVFSAGFFTFKPLQKPELCYQEPNPAKSPQLGSTKTYVPFIGLPLPTFPQLPRFPQLPPLPSLPVSPTWPIFASPTLTKLDATPSSSAQVSDQKQDQPPLLPPSPTVPSFGGAAGLPPNPFLPPSFLPSNPFQPPPSVLPSLPFQPPPPSFSIPLPRLTPPSLAPPVFPFPSFPFPPSPFFPGIPPASPSGRAAP